MPTPQVPHRGPPLTFSGTVRKRELETSRGAPPLGESAVNTLGTLNGVEKLTRMGKKFTGNPIPPGSHLRNERLGDLSTLVLRHTPLSNLSPQGLLQSQEIDDDLLFLRDNVPLATKTTLANAGHQARLLHAEELEIKKILKDQQLALVAKGISMKELEERELTDAAINERVLFMIREGKRRNQQMAEAAMAPRKFHLREPGLPPGWKVVKSRAGETYYYNPSTRQTTWEFPGAPAAAAPAAANVARAQEMAAARKEFGSLAGSPYAEQGFAVAAAPAAGAAGAASAAVPAAAAQRVAAASSSVQYHPAIFGKSLPMPPQAVVQAVLPSRVDDNELYAWHAIRLGLNPLTATRGPSLLPGIRRMKAEEEALASKKGKTVLELRNEIATNAFEHASTCIKEAYQKLNEEPEKSKLAIIDEAREGFKVALTRKTPSKELERLLQSAIEQIAFFKNQLDKLNGENVGNPYYVSDKLQELDNILHDRYLFSPFISLYKVEVESPLSPGGGSSSQGGKRTRKYKRKTKKTKKHRR